MLGKKIGVDLGSTMVRLHVRGEGAVVREPAVVATTEGGGRVIAVGSQALEIHGGGSELRRPLREGSIADSLAVTVLVQHMVAKATGRQRIFRPDVMIAVHSTMSGADRRHIIDAAARAGARTTYLIDVPLAAAIGAGLAVSTPTGHLVVDLGAETTEVAVVALEGTVVARCLPVGGRHVTAAIAAALGAAHGARVDAAAAEDAKLEIGSAAELAEERTLRIPAHDQQGRQAEITVSSTEVGIALLPFLRRLDDAVRTVLAECPPALLPDITQRSGLVLTGAGAALRGLDRHLAAATGLRVTIASDPEGCTGRGTANALDSLDVVRRNSLYVR